jgi:hypothetical protein
LGGWEAGIGHRVSFRGLFDNPWDANPITFALT